MYISDLAPVYVSDDAWFGGRAPGLLMVAKLNSDGDLLAIPLDLLRKRCKVGWGFQSSLDCSEELEGGLVPLGNLFIL